MLNQAREATGYRRLRADVRSENEKNYKDGRSSFTRDRRTIRSFATNLPMAHQSSLRLQHDQGLWAIGVGDCRDGRRPPMGTTVSSVQNPLCAVPESKVDLVHTVEEDGVHTQDIMRHSSLALLDQGGDKGSGNHLLLEYQG